LVSLYGFLEQEMRAISSNKYGGSCFFIPKINQLFFVYANIC
jgi:hypothetical protein